MGRSMASSSSQRQLLLAVIWVAVSALLAVALQTLGVNQAFGDDGSPALTGMAVEYPLAGPNPAAQSKPSALYAGLMVTVTDTRVTPATDFLNRAKVEVDLDVTNTLKLTQLRMPASMLSLVSSDGNVVTRPHFANAGTRLNLDPGQTDSVTVVFAVSFTPNPDPASLTLQIGEINRIPATIPVAGTAAPSDAAPGDAAPATAPAGSPGDQGAVDGAAAGPVYAAVDATPSALTDPDNATRQIVVQPEAATVDVNAGPYRAATGERLAVVKVVLQRAAINDDSTFLTPAYWALESSAGSSQAVLAARGAPAASNADEVTLVFDFPADAQNLKLVAAAGRPEATGFALVLPLAS